MGLVKWNPVLNDRFFDEFFGLTPTRVRTNGNGHPATLPAVNIKETENDYRLELAVPGLDKEDFKIEVNEGVLTVSAERKDEHTDEKDGYSRREFRYASFQRRFTLPETANDADITAKYDNGILHLIVPKKEEAKPQPARLIEIG
jgi:HSP20 family protein